MKYIILETNEEYLESEKMSETSTQPMCPWIGRERISTRINGNNLHKENQRRESQ